MIRHVVMWKFKEGSEAEMKRFLDGLKALVGQIDCLRSLETGINVNPKEQFNAVLICRFDSLEDLAKYDGDPRHAACKAIIKPICLERVAVDFEE